jgi:hypothetical protein
VNEFTTGQPLQGPGNVENTILLNGIQAYVRSIISSQDAQFLQDVSTRAAGVGVFTRPGSKSGPRPSAECSETVILEPVKQFLMPPRRPSKKDSPAKLAGRMKRRWRVVLLRSKGEILGTVEAPDVAAAKAAAAIQFDLDEIQRNRIMVQELA